MKLLSSYLCLGWIALMFLAYDLILRGIPSAISFIIIMIFSLISIIYIIAASCDEFERKMRSTVMKLEEQKRERSSTDNTKDLDYYIYRLNAMCTLSANGYFSVNR